MSAKILDDIRHDALSLPLGERAELARDLIASLDGPPDADARVEWDKEICRRINEIRSGQAVLLEPDDVISRIRARLKQA
jgi:putative addiction module component (TIGR02574 family)